jgi:hypothetical protein
MTAQHPASPPDPPDAVGPLAARAPVSRKAEAGRAGRTLVAIAVLLAVAAVVGAGGLVFWSGRPGGARALAIAGLACLPGFLFGRILLGTAPADPARAFAAALAAIALRTVVPLAALAWLTAGRPAPAAPADGPPQVDAAGTLVAFYLALLAADVVLHVAAAPHDGRGH